MSRLKTYPITHYEFDDLIKALDTDREGIAKICGGIAKGAIGWWRFKERIPVLHLESLAKALEKKLKGRKDLNPVEQRALIFAQLALASGSAAPLSPQSAFAATFEPTKTIKSDYSAISLEDLIAEIKKRGGSVTFDSKKRKKSK